MHIVSKYIERDAGMKLSGRVLDQNITKSSGYCTYSKKYIRCSYLWVRMFNENINFARMDLLIEYNLHQPLAAFIVEMEKADPGNNAKNS